VILGYTFLFEQMFKKRSRYGSSLPLSFWPGWVSYFPVKVTNGCGIWNDALPGDGATAFFHLSPIMSIFHVCKFFVCLYKVDAVF